MTSALPTLVALLACRADGSLGASWGTDVPLPDPAGGGDGTEVVGDDGDDTGDSGDSPPGVCDDGVFQCAWDEGCVDGVCGGCEDADDCYETDGCRADATCGACSADEECQEGRSCVAGACLPSHLPQWNLALSAADFAALVDDAYQDTYVPCTLVADGVDYGACTVRLRGASTRSLPKKSFRVEFPEGVDHPGYTRKIDLRAEYNDPSYLRSFLGLELARRATTLPTPRARFLTLDLTLTDDAGSQVVHQGLMLEVERVGASSFLERHGRDPDAPVYEAVAVDGHGALTPNADPDEYAAFYEKAGGDESDFAELRSFVEDTLAADWADALASGTNLATRSQGAIHVDAYLRYLETMALLQAKDHVTNNFHFSKQTVGGVAAWEFYPEDMDLTFGCVWDSVEGDAICDAFAYEGWWMDGIYVVDDGFVLGTTEYWGNLAIHEVITQPELEERYEDELCALASGDLWNERLPALGAAVAESVRGAVDADEQDLNASLDDFDAATAEVQSFFSLRRDYLRAQLACP